jgi:hypothetical protein
VVYDEFDFLDTTTTIHKGVAAMSSKSKQEWKYKSTFFDIGNNKRMYFYNNTLSTFHAVLVRSITDELAEAYSQPFD